MGYLSVQNIQEPGPSNVVNITLYKFAVVFLEICLIFLLPG